MLLWAITVNENKNFRNINNKDRFKFKYNFLLRNFMVEVHFFNMILSVCVKESKPQISSIQLYFWMKDNLEKKKKKQKPYLVFLAFT